MDMEQIAKTIVAQATPDLTPDKAAEMQQHVMQLLLARVGTAIVTAMSPEDRLTYEQQFITTQKYNTPEAQAFVAQHVPNLADVLKAEIDAVTSELTKA